MSDIGLLILRVGAAGMLFFGHGLGKMLNIAQTSAHFPDPLHIGHTASFALALFGEAFCTVAVALGLWTRFAAIPPLITMVVAVALVHTHDVWGRKELPLLYALAFAAIALLGPGSYSFDVIVRKKR